MQSWGGLREGAGRPAQFDKRVAKLVYFDESELEEMNRLATTIQEAEGEPVSLSAILRSLALDWLERTKETYVGEYRASAEAQEEDA